MVGTGIFIILICLGLLALDPVITRLTTKRDRNGEIIAEGIDLVSTKWQKLALFGGMILGFILVFNPFCKNDAGDRQVVQTLGGDLSVRFEPGLYYSGFFSKVTTYPNNVTLQVGPKEKRSDDSDYWTASNTGTFAEGDQAEMGHTVKWDLPGTEEVMIDLHTTYGGINNLATTTLMQYQRETASYSCQRMSSEAHYSGGQSQLKDYFQDQLRNGQVLLVTETKTETQDDGSSKTYIEVVERVDDNGRYLRSPNEDIQQFDLRPSFVSVDYIKYDPEIYTKLQTKIKFAAEEANSKQELVAAQQKEQTSIVKGRAQIAETRAREEAKEQEAVINARKLKLVAKEEAEQAKYTADRIEEEGRAQAAANRALVAAGLTPEQQMKLEIEIADKVSANLAKLQFPEMMVIGGSGNGSAMNPFDAVGLESFMRIQKEFTGNSNKKR